jgi:hypothetical protein
VIICNEGACCVIYFRSEPKITFSISQPDCTNYIQIQSPHCVLHLVQS